MSSISRSNKLNSVQISSTAPSTGQVLTSVDATHADWETPTGGGTPSGANGSVQFSESSAFASDNSNLFWDNSAKRLGIGTNAPAYKLDVSDDVAFRGGNFNIIPSSNTEIVLNFGVSGNAPSRIVFNGGSFNYEIRKTDTGSTPLWKFGLTGDSVAAMTIDKFKNIGLGTDAPDSKLHVVGAIKIVDGSQGNGKILTSDVNGLASWVTSTGITGSGTINKLPKFTGSASIGDSNISDDGSTISVGTSSNTITLNTLFNITFDSGARTSRLAFASGEGSIELVAGGNDHSGSNHAEIRLLAGNGTSGKDGGRALLQSGSADASNAGPVQILSGSGAAGGSGGAISITAGNSSGGAGGSIILSAGTGVTSGKVVVASSFKIADGSEGASKVLTSDASGNTTWQTPTSSLFFASPQTSPGASLTSYGWSGTAVSSESLAATIMPRAAVVSKMYVIPNQATAALSSSTITLRKNGVDTLLSVSFGASISTTQSDLSDSISFNAGDTIDLAVTSGTIPPAVTFNISLTIS